MANSRSCYSDPTSMNSGGAGVCMMSSLWRDEQHPSFISFISSFLSANSFRLNFVLIAPDFIFNCGGLSISFVFITKWNCENIAPVFSRVKKLKGQFANLYVVVTLPTRDQNDSFVCSYFKYGMELGRPTFVPVQDVEMGFEKIVKLALSRGMCKQQNITSKLKAERKRSVEGIDIFLRVITSIPSIDNHDANSGLASRYTEIQGILINGQSSTIPNMINLLDKLIQGIGSIEAIAKASKEKILENTDLSADKADTITRFFRDSKLYLSPKIN